MITKGRPLTSPQVRDKLVGLRLNETELKCLTGYAGRYEMSVSDVIRLCLETFSVTPINPLSN